ncbi:MAG: Crp/Fnr family transcriptional regulator [Flavobacteriales bacterium]|nr:Crp/Fnr family transcriptional regulator [Flavobacteriales bacterium]
MNNSELKKIIEFSFQNIDKKTIDIIVNHSSFVELNKGSELFSEGKRHHYFYLIVKGGVKSYYAKESKEVCTWFAFENEIIGTTSTLQGLPSNESIQLLEDSSLIRFNTQKMNELTQTNLKMCQLLNSLWAEHSLFLETRLRLLQFTNSQERLEALIKFNSEIFQRVSLTDIASFLGISRETLSRIRAKK